MNLKEFSYFRRIRLNMQISMVSMFSDDYAESMEFYWKLNPPQILW